MNVSLAPEFQDYVTRKELRRELALGIEEADQGKTAPLSAQETLARVRMNGETLARKQA